MDRRVGLRQVQADTTGFEADQKQGHCAAGELGDQVVALPALAIRLTGAMISAGKFRRPGSYSIWRCASVRRLLPRPMRYNSRARAQLMLSHCCSSEAKSSQRLELCQWVCMK